MGGYHFLFRYIVMNMGNLNEVKYSLLNEFCVIKKN
jgi:hypothetical protein